MKNERASGDGLAIDEDIEFQERYWRFQKAAWAFLALFLLLTTLGLFGGGPLSQRTLAAGDGGFVLKYEALGRRGAASDFALRSRSGGDGSFTVELANEFLSGVELRAITPLPERSVAGGTWTVFHFAGAAGDAESRVSFRWVPQSAGPIHARVRVNGRERAFLLFIYP